MVLHSLPSVKGDRIMQLIRNIGSTIPIAKDAVDTEDPDRLPGLEGSPYYTSTITGPERAADPIANVGCSICNPVGDDKENNEAKRRIIDAHTYRSTKHPA